MPGLEPGRPFSGSTTDNRNFDTLNDGVDAITGNDHSQSFTDWLSDQWGNFGGGGG